MEEQFIEVYEELKRLAHAFFRKERKNHTLQPTALVHEAFLKLQNENKLDFQNKKHFIAMAAHSMRCILIDYARSKNADKRGGGDIQVTFNEEQMGQDNDLANLVELDRALSELEKINPRHSKLVELRYFAGLGLEEAAEALEVSVATVKRDWDIAKVFLFKKLNPNT